MHFAGGEPYYSSGTSDSEAFDNAFKKVINGLGKSIITVIIEVLFYELINQLTYL